MDWQPFLVPEEQIGTARALLENHAATVDFILRMTAASQVKANTPVVTGPDPAIMFLFNTGCQDKGCTQTLPHALAAVVFRNVRIDSDALATELATIPVPHTLTIRDNVLFIQYAPV